MRSFSGPLYGFAVDIADEPLPGPAGKTNDAEVNARPANQADLPLHPGRTHAGRTSRTSLRNRMKHP